MIGMGKEQGSCRQSKIEIQDFRGEQNITRINILNIWETPKRKENYSISLIAQYD